MPVRQDQARHHAKYDRPNRSAHLVGPGISVCWHSDEPCDPALHGLSEGSRRPLGLGFDLGNSCGLKAPHLASEPKRRQSIAC